jgi:hypothetical protein
LSVSEGAVAGINAMITFGAFAADKIIQKDHPFTAKRMQRFIFGSECVFRCRLPTTGN